ncbi:MAG: AarF/ABC1/UbiB kinase family protein, partial [Bacilli bacterium]|nr:AarF/ABC1/UbiB kinase family protein [Bacilli bacterium]
ICDNCNPISYNEIEEILKQEYGTNLENIFSYIEKKPVGSASVSQVHRAILKTGEEVAIKIKRKDITKTIDKDIKRIRKIIHRFGKFVNFSNFTGGDHAFDLYLEWIEQETNFVHEKENIKMYKNFADSVNGKVNGTKKIKVPKLYEEYCTDNVIVMEFIRNKTINKLELTDANKDKITTALNSYIRSSFWAMFNDKQIVFHGDPHSGNICIDEEGNIYFLDMGLLCVLSENDAKLCRKFFLTAYSGNYEKLYDMLVSYGNMNEEEKKSFKENCKKYCEEVKKKEVTYYFIDMINVCLNYEFVPPNFLFSMAKAFVCLNGISNFSDNKCTAKELLQEQTIEFLVKRSLKDCKGIVMDSLHIAPKALENIIQYGLVNTIAKVTTSSEIKKDVRKSLENLEEMLDLAKLFYCEETPFQHEHQQRTKHL